MLNSKDLNFSFSGLKTAVLTLVNNNQPLTDDVKKDIAWEFQEAVTEILTAKCMSALRETGLDNLVVSGGVGSNTRLRERLNAAAKRKLCVVSYPRLEFCTDNGAMIAFAGALRLKAHALQANTEAASSSIIKGTASGGYAFSIKPRWDLSELTKP